MSEKRAMPPYVGKFLRAVATNPGGKYPVGSYYPSDNADAEPSWKIAERKGWVKCRGSHKWVLTIAGLRALHAATNTEGQHQ